jgi:hypothetical protein
MVNPEEPCGIIVLLDGQQPRIGQAPIGSLPSGSKKLLSATADAESGTVLRTAVALAIACALRRAAVKWGSWPARQKPAALRQL